LTEPMIEEIRTHSFQRPQVIFKHSTRCGTSGMVKNRLEKATEPGKAEFYFLDVIRSRSLSDQVAATFHVRHESPQILVIRQGICIYHESHFGIDMESIRANLDTAESAR